MVILERSEDGKTVRRQAMVSMVEIEMALHLFVDVTDETSILYSVDVTFLLQWVVTREEKARYMDVNEKRDVLRRSTVTK